MDSSKQTRGEQDQAVEYSKPQVTDYGTLVEMTAVGGTVAPKDVPLGHPNSAFPS